MKVPDATPEERTTHRQLQGQILAQEERKAERSSWLDVISDNGTRTF